MDWAESLWYAILTFHFKYSMQQKKIEWEQLDLLRLKTLRTLQWSQRWIVYSIKQRIKAQPNSIKFPKYLSQQNYSKKLSTIHQNLKEALNN